MLERHGPPLDVEEHKIQRDRETAAAAQASHTLGDMAEEVSFFTTALFFTAGRFDRDPIVEYLKLDAKHAAAQPHAIDYPHPFFQGLGTTPLGGRPVNWDHRLYAIRNDYLDGFRNIVAGMVWTNRSKLLYSKAAFYELEIVDPIAFYKRGGLLPALPLITITVFAVSSNSGFTYLSPAADPPRTRAYPVTERPKPDVVQEAARVLQPPSYETLSRRSG